ncbi:MAG: hypothetical protein ABW164_08905 [Sphingobium sp.]
MTLCSRLSLSFLVACAALPLAACGSEKSGNSVQMRDMEVVDGTATDAMTDLDGVQSEGTAVAVPSGNASNNSASTGNAVAAPDDGDAEVVSDQ